MGSQRRVARLDTIPSEGARTRQALQPGLYVDLRLRQEELSHSVLYLQDAAVLQQDHVQGSRPVRSANVVRRTDYVFAGDGEGREDGVHHPQLRLAILAADEDEWHRIADAGHEEASLQHSRGGRRSRSACEGD